MLFIDAERNKVGLGEGGGEVVGVKLERLLGGEAGETGDGIKKSERAVTMFGFGIVDVGVDVGVLGVDADDVVVVVVVVAEVVGERVGVEGVL